MQEDGIPAGLEVERLSDPLRLGHERQRQEVRVSDSTKNANPKRCHAVAFCRTGSERIWEDPPFFDSGEPPGRERRNSGKMIEVIKDLKARLLVSSIIA